MYAIILSGSFYPMAERAGTMHFAQIASLWKDIG